MERDRILETFPSVDKKQDIAQGGSLSTRTVSRAVTPKGAQHLPWPHSVSQAGEGFGGSCPSARNYWGLHSRERSAVHGHGADFV